MIIVSVMVQLCWRAAGTLSAMTPQTLTLACREIEELTLNRFPNSSEVMQKHNEGHMTPHRVTAAITASVQITDHCIETNDLILACKSIFLNILNTDLNGIFRFVL